MGVAEDIAWKKSRRSAEIGACLQVAPFDAEVEERDVDGGIVRVITRLEPAVRASARLGTARLLTEPPVTLTRANGEASGGLDDTPPADVTAPAWFGLPGAPAGVRWTQARWARSWGLTFGTTGPGSLFEAILSAGGGSVAVTSFDGPQVIRDAATLRRLLATAMTRRPPAEGLRRWPQIVQEYVSAATEQAVSRPGAAGLSAEQVEQQVQAQIDGGQAWWQVWSSVAEPGRWEELADRVVPALIGEYLGLSLLTVATDGRLSAYGPDTASLTVIMAAGTGPASQWVGAQPAAAGLALAGLSARQVAWAADAGMRFVGPDPQAGPADFVGTLMTAARAANVPMLYQGDAGQLRHELAKRLRGDRDLAASPDWIAISDEYVRAKVLAGGSDIDARRRLDSGEALQEIIAHVKNHERGNTVIGRMWPLLVNRYTGTGVRVLPADAQQQLLGGADITMAATLGQSPAEDVWVGLAPIAAPTFAGAGTRPADVPGGWSTPSPDRPPATTELPEPVVPAPIGVTAAQTQWARRHRMRFATMPVGQGRLLDAVLSATGGGFTTKDGLFVDTTADLRNQLIQRITDARDTDLDLWLAIYTTYAAHYPRRNPGPHGERGLAQQVSERIDSGQALADIIQAITDPTYWPELADELTPFLLNRLDLGVRVIGPDGRPGKYGRGKPAYIAQVAPETETGHQRWVALQPAPTRYPATSPLASPSLADPLLTLLARAIDHRKAMTGDPADPVVQQLRQARNQWLVLTSPADISETGRPVAVPTWDATQVRELVDQISEATTGADALGMGMAVQVLNALFPSVHGGIRPAPAGDENGDENGDERAAELPGLPATEWTVAPSVEELIDALPESAAALFFDGQHMRLLIDTTDGHLIASFGPGQPAGTRVTIPTPDLLDSLASDGLALVIRGTRTVPAAMLGGPFIPAMNSPRVDELLDAPQARLGVAGDAALMAAPAAISRPQRVWAQSNRARFVEVAPGPNAFFDAVIAAAGGRLAGNGVQATEATTVRAALAQAIRDMAATDGLRDWPTIQAAYIFAGEARILTDFFGNDPTEVVRQVLHAQLNEHINTGEAWNFIKTAIARPGHWDQITDQLAPDLLTDVFGFSLVIIDSQGRTRLHGDAGGQRLVVAHTQADAGAQRGWAAVIPDAQAQDQAITRPLADLAIDTATALTKRVATGETASLNADQQRTAGNEQLRIEPTEIGATSFSSAVLTAAGGGFLLDSDTYIGSPEQLREILATVLRDRPDILPPAAGEQIQQITNGMDAEDLVDAVKNPADPVGDQIAQHLVAPYLGINLHVIGTDGTITEQGAGQQITVAPTSKDGQPHWAALVPTIQTPHVGAHLPTLPGLPDLFHFDQPASGTPWNTGDYKILEPDTGKIDDPWRDSTFSRNEVGESIYCVSVAVISRPVA